MAPTRSRLLSCPGAHAPFRLQLPSNVRLRLPGNVDVWRPGSFPTTSGTYSASRHVTWRWHANVRQPRRRHPRLTKVAPAVSSTTCHLRIAPGIGIRRRRHAGTSRPRSMAGPFSFMLAPQPTKACRTRCNEDMNATPSWKATRWLNLPLVIDLIPTAPRLARRPTTWRHRNQHRYHLFLRVASGH